MRSDIRRAKKRKPAGDIGGPTGSGPWVACSVKLAEKNVASHLLHSDHFERPDHPERACWADDSERAAELGHSVEPRAELIAAGRCCCAAPNSPRHSSRARQRRSA